ncbi:hypothetical protein KCU92_g6882, partial [Aureobasidium melanogenum]
MDMSPVLEYLRNGNPFLNTAAPPPIYHFQLPSWNSPAAEIIRGNNINAQQLPVSNAPRGPVPVLALIRLSYSPAYAAMPSTASSSPCAPMAIDTSGGLAATSMGLTFVVNGVTYPRIENALEGQGQRQFVKVYYERVASILEQHKDMPSRSIRAYGAKFTYYVFFGGDAEGPASQWSIQGDKHEEPVPSTQE